MRSAPRLRYVAGSWLLARDQRESHTLGYQRLAHHHIAAHHTWGIAAGLDVIVSDGSARVVPGCAVDRCGRLLVLESVSWVPAPRPPVYIVLTDARSPAAQVTVREIGRMALLDIPLARIDNLGQLHTGDGDRQWLRRPGPTLTLGATVERGARAEGTRSMWWHDVDLSSHRLAAAPTVVVTPAGPQPPPRRTTVELTEVTATGFRIVIRHPTGQDADPSADPVRTAPFALNWMAVLPAARTPITLPEDWRRQ
ncbi:hypothetical protein ACWF0M_01330 [Kribbella sp. NPDC055110]